MPYLLDTNIVSFILKSPQGVAAERFRMTASDQMFVPSVVEAELRFGAQRMPAAARLPQLLEVFLSEIRILTWDSDCARQHATLRNRLERTSLSWPDSMIAAHALALDYTLTTNDGAFARVPGLRLQDWTLGPRASMIAVIDYKAGNLTSVVKALKFLGAENVVVTQSPEEVLRAEKIVLPGVGHFQATQLLQDLGLTSAVREAVAKGKPFLGICVGLQWLYAGSTEAPGTAGLGHFSGKCERFPALYEGEELKSPHVGWNSLEAVREDSRLLRGVVPGSFVYYTHSWRAPLSADTAAATMYGGAFTGAVERGNVMGVQFHPEKSAETGLRVLRNFLEL